MTVYLVGAGPGDPGLLTVRAARLLARADVVVHDRLVDPRVLDLVPASATLVDVGKRPPSGSSEQEAINEILVEYAHKFDCVVRLKGGDPFVFARGGEEVLALEAGHCDYEVVPGVSSIAAVPGAAGVPLTMRGVASSVIVLTGRDGLDSAQSAADWRAAATSNATIVVIMGVATRGEIAQRLINEGRDADTPVLIVESGTTPQQRSTRTRLCDLGATPVEAPATIVIGEVARYSFKGYADRPLATWRVAVTRAADHADGLVARLEDEGADVMVVPTIEIIDPQDHGDALRTHLGRLTEYDWVVFSSQNAVERVLAELQDARSFGGVRVAAIGSATADLLGRHGIVADFVPSRFVAESFVDEFPQRSSSNGSAKVLLPRAADGRDVIEVGLSELGWQVDAVVAYQTVHPQIGPDALARLHEADVITFASSSAVEGVFAASSPTELSGVVASIGPITSGAARSFGVEVAIEAREHTVNGLVEEIIAYARAHPRRERV